MRLVFVHGWAFGPDCFDALAPRLADWPQVRADLGFFGAVKIPDFAPSDVLVGHSMGLAWGLSQHKNWAGVVAINAFARFVKDEAGRGCARAAELRALRKNFIRDAQACVDAFRTRHGGGPCVAPDTDSLMKGLDFLESCDARAPFHGERWAPRATTAQKSSATPPMLGLAAEDDPLVPLDAARELAQSGGELFFSATGGHGLPWTAPAFCAEKIREFLRRHGW